jgi:hypothetical protein
MKLIKVCEEQFIILTFDGTAGKGANSQGITIDSDYKLENGEYICGVFYRVTTPLVSGDGAGTYIELGIPVDDASAILNSTTGIVDTLNAGAIGTKISHSYTKATTTRDITGDVKGTSDITAGEIEIVVSIAKTRLGRVPKPIIPIESITEALPVEEQILPVKEPVNPGAEEEA